MFGNDPQTAQVILSLHGFRVYWLCQIFCTCQEFVETANAEWQTAERDCCHIHRCCNRRSFIAAAVGLNFINRPVILLCTKKKKTENQSDSGTCSSPLTWEQTKKYKCERQTAVNDFLVSFQTSCCSFFVVPLELRWLWSDSSRRK